MTSSEILIAGAGIAGLTAALAFARCGRNVRICEKTSELTEVGAGLQLSPNATRILHALGLEPALEAVAHRPPAIQLASGRTLAPLAHVPLGRFAEARWGAPYCVIHRSELQAMLVDAVRSEPLCHLELGATINPSHLPASADGLVIGADGVWSQMRGSVAGSAAPDFSGQIAWRFMADAVDLAGVLDPANVTAFLGPASHLVAYPVRGGASVNIVAIAGGRDPGHTWNAAEPIGGRTHLTARFRHWHPALREILEKAGDMQLWPIHELADGAFTDGSARVLIGDAAHAMAPFAAQGAAMAIEDAWELAASGAGGLTRTERTSALRWWEQARRARISRARSRAAFNRFAYHARGPVRLGRDLVLSMRSPESLAADFDWLYGWRGTGLAQ